MSGKFGSIFPEKFKEAHLLGLNVAHLTEVERLLYKPDVLHSVFGGLILWGNSY